MSNVFGYHEGNRSEYLAEFVLSTIGFPVRVSRASDLFLTDYFVHLFQRREQVLKVTGLTFAIQIKSDESPIEIDSDDQIKCFIESSIPFFIAVLDKKSDQFSVYTTIHRLLISQPFPSQLKLIFRGDELRAPSPSGEFFLGPPICTGKIGDLDCTDDTIRKEARNTFGCTLRPWTLHDGISIAWRKSKWPLIMLPTYETNKFDPNAFEIAYIEDEFRDLEKTLCAFQMRLMAFKSYLNDAFAARKLDTGEIKILTAMAKTMDELMAQIAGAKGAKV